MSDTEAPAEKTQSIRDMLYRIRQIRYSLETEDFTPLSGELEKTDEFKELCFALAEEALEREAEAEVIEARIKDMQARKSRVLQGAETIRDIILQGMEIRNHPTIQSPVLTLSKSKLQPEVIVEDESAIPSAYFVPQAPKLDKKALREAVLKDGEVIDGVTVKDSKISLTIRRK